LQRLWFGLNGAACPESCYKPASSRCRPRYGSFPRWLAGRRVTRKVTQSCKSAEAQKAAIPIEIVDMYREYGFISCGPLGTRNGRCAITGSIGPRFASAVANLRLGWSNGRYFMLYGSDNGRCAITGSIGPRFTCAVANMRLDWPYGRYFVLYGSDNGRCAITGIQLELD
jgi:hypothetical protein